MKIYTKKGDSGTTQLIGGTRVSKAAIQIESYGTVDELNSYIGLIRDQQIDKHTFDVLIEIQDRLFTIGSLLAEDKTKSKMKLPQLFDTDVELLEKEIDNIDKTLPSMKSFILPGGHTTVSYCHIARCICRRAERLVVQLSENIELDALIKQYLNRLSDYLFVLSRKFSQDLNAIEIPWEPRN